MNDKPTEHEIAYVRESLMQFNEVRVGADGHTPLNLVEYGADGTVIGGLLGGTYWGWMYVDILWVDEKHRQKGIGGGCSVENITGQQHQVAVFLQSQIHHQLRQRGQSLTQRVGLAQGRTQMPVSAVKQFHRKDQPFRLFGKGLWLRQW